MKRARNLCEVMHSQTKNRPPLGEGREMLGETRERPRSLRSAVHDVLERLISSWF